MTTDTRAHPLDATLDKIATGTRLVVCSAEPLRLADARPTNSTEDSRDG